MRALVVDDSRAMRLLIKKQLHQLGFETVEAAHGAEALERLRAQDLPINVALVDWNMPVMSGIELLREIRKDPELAWLPILMVTSESELTAVSDALEAGANEYLMKPFTEDGLRDKLELIGAVS